VFFPCLFLYFYFCLISLVCRPYWGRLTVHTLKAPFSPQPAKLLKANPTQDTHTHRQFIKFNVCKIAATNAAKGNLRPPNRPLDHPAVVIFPPQTPKKEEEVPS